MDFFFFFFPHLRAFAHNNRIPIWNEESKNRESSFYSGKALSAASWRQALGRGHTDGGNGNVWEHRYSLWPYLTSIRISTNERTRSPHRFPLFSLPLSTSLALCTAWTDLRETKCGCHHLAHCSCALASSFHVRRSAEVARHFLTGSSLQPLFRHRIPIFIRVAGKGTAPPRPQNKYDTWRTFKDIRLYTTRLASQHR